MQCPRGQHHPAPPTTRMIKDKTQLIHLRFVKGLRVQRDCKTSRLARWGGGGGWVIKTVDPKGKGKDHGDYNPAPSVLSDVCSTKQGESSPDGVDHPTVPNPPRHTRVYGFNA
jgi:hypothetical protein